VSGGQAAEIAERAVGVDEEQAVGLMEASSPYLLAITTRP
jgi:hypothetical protein